MMTILLTGVSGCGKTTVGRHLARRRNWVFHDGDDFHPLANVEKMSRGQPLTDEDRQPWLDALKELLRRLDRENTSAAVACSALKRAYRRQLADACPGAFFVFLRGDYELFARRLKNRRGHYFKPRLLRSQFEALEPPGPDEALAVDASLPPEEIVSVIINKSRSLAGGDRR